MIGMAKLSKISVEMREWRKRNLLSQKDFALALGVVLRTIWGIEAGEHSPSLQAQRRFRELKERYARNRRVYLRNPTLPETASGRSRAFADSPETYAK